jgi:hypothetical protein
MRNSRRISLTRIQLVSRFALALDFPLQPGTSVRPIALGRRWGDPKHAGSFFSGAAAEITQLDQFRLDGSLGGERRQRLIERDEIIVGRRGAWLHFTEVQALSVASTFEAAPFSSVVDQDATHRLGCRREKMPATIPFAFRVRPDKSQIRFMDQGGWLLS